MTSTRPQQRMFAFAHEQTESPFAAEPQRGQSDLAAMKKTALSPVPDSLMEQIVDQANVERAWKKVRTNGGAPGPDGVSLQAFPAIFREQWQTIRQQLLDGTYQPSPARRHAISKPDGSDRFLGIPNVLDRLIQQAVLQILTPIFDPTFSESSFGFRPKRSAQQAALQVQAHIRAGYRQCVDMDLSKFFDRIQHDVLMARLSRRIRDKILLGLIGKYLRAGVMVDTQLQPSIEGRAHTAGGSARRSSLSDLSERPVG